MTEPHPGHQATDPVERAGAGLAPDRQVAGVDEESRTGWFGGARFGMFVHWGHRSTRGGDLSWPLVGGAGDVLPHAHPVAAAEYHAGALDFCPQPGAARGWMALARRAGMRYAVLTAMHHDGFALWPTEQTDWSIAVTPYGGDLVAEFVDAARAEGLRVGLYFSLSDWHHPDYPAFRDEDRPYFFRYLGRRSSAEGWQRYLGVLFGQVEELLTRYGPIDLLWFDGQWERSRDEWRAAELAAHVRALQPGVVINDRLPGEGDFDTPEQALPSSTPGRAWETCMTMNRSWGWCPDDTDYKGARELTHALCEVAGRGGNLLLNVGPRADGSLPEEQVIRLERIARWTTANGEAIHGTQPGLEPWQFYGPTTGAGERIFLHLLYRPYETVTVRGLALDQVRSVRHLATRRELDWTPDAPVQALMAGGAVGQAVIRVPAELVDDLATVIEIVLRPG